MQRVQLRLAIALAAAGLSALIPTGPSSPQEAAAQTRRLTVVLTGSNVNQLSAGHPLVRAFFNHRRIYSLGNPAADQVQATDTPRATPTLIYRSYAAFVSDVTMRRIDSRIQAVAYDPEYWSDTPAAEQVDPVAYMQRFATLARDHGYSVILAPGRDLMEAPGALCHTLSGETLDHAYLRCGMPAAAARVADIVEVQSQVDEFSPRRYRSLLQRAAAQAHASNAAVKVLAGISTQPPSGTATFASMVDDAKIATAETDGVWVNVFSSHPAQKRVGGLLFRWLARHSD